MNVDVEQVNERGELRHLINLGTLDRSRLEEILGLAARYLTPVGGPAPRDDILKGCTVANLFFEASTRTRASFELAAKRLRADVLNLDVNMSSRAKGESIMDTIFTLQAMQVDVLRRSRRGARACQRRIAQQVAPHVCVLNAGESTSRTPRRVFSTLLTVQRHKGDLAKLCVAIVGDIKPRGLRAPLTRRLPSSVSASCGSSGRGALPGDDEFAGTVRVAELADGIRGADVVMALRVQQERFAQLGDIPDPQEYFRRYGLTEERLEAGASATRS